MKMEKTDKSIHAGHRQRVKANVCNNGFSQLEDHRLLELVLFYAIPQADTNVLAHRLLDEFGSLKNVFNADINHLMQVKGVGKSTAVMIAAMGEVYRRSKKGDADKRRIYKSHKDFCELAVSQLAGESKERTMAFFFDSVGRLKKQIALSDGDETSVHIDVKKVVQNAMLCDAVGVVIAHNHPGRTNAPSLNDIDTTRSLCVMLRKLGIEMYDHVILDGNDKPYSMYEDASTKALFY